MRLIRRYIFMEILPPTLISLLLFTFVMVMDVIFEIAELALKKNLGIWLVSRLFLLNLPHIIVLTVPMAVLLGTIIAFSRLSTDSEIVACHSVGISVYRLLQPTLLFAFLATGLTAFLMIQVLPWGNRALLRMEEEILSISITRVVEPRIFYDEFPQKVVYFHDYGADGREWRGVFIADATDPKGRQIISARSAYLSYDEHSDQLWLRLEGGSIHTSEAAAPDRYQFSSFREMKVLLKDGVLRETREKVVLEEVHDPKLRAKTLRELLEIARQSTDPSQRSRFNLAWLNIHKKFSIPFSCLVLSLIAVGLGISNARGGRSSAFVLAIAVIIVYWIFIDSGEALAVQGRLPPAIGMWLPNIVLGLIGLGMVLLRSRNRNFDLSEMGVRAWGAIRGWLGLRAADLPEAAAEEFPAEPALLPRAPAEAGPEFGSALPADSQPEPTAERRSLPRFAIPFPNLLDRYLLSQYISVASLVLVGFVALFVIVDFFQLVDKIIRNQIPVRTILRYYVFFMPQIVFYILLIINLVSTLVTFGILSRHNEITAIKGCGVSLHRLSLPILLVALVSCVFSFYLEERILPQTNQQYDRLKDEIKGKPVSTQFRLRKWIFGEDGNRVYNYENINFEQGSMASLSAFDFSPQDFSLKRWTFARQAQYRRGSWELVNGWSKSFASQEEVAYEEFARRPSSFHESPEYFRKEWKEPEQMNWRELRGYMEELRRSGYVVDPELEVDFHSKFAMPLVPLVMTVLGISFAFKMGKRGSLYGIGISIMLGIIYWILIAFSSQLGALQALPPLLAAWGPNVLFSIGGLYLVLTLRT